MDRRGKADWHYKAININKVGDIFAGIFTNPSLAGRIIIPMPPSKCKVLSSSVFGANLTFSFWVVLLSVGACL
ncbi:hypothetical protein SAMN04488109_1812 [Chryseolinea serpens]|uniref:Uncharacterized protein n=2 Tax=Chryseolinea serpens TaxID=947013 RepID=A0A1M5MLX5_9BACT|nr:hypothetical protein SAMN04488109_1812 [Chryseolinea serpens]